MRRWLFLIFFVPSVAEAGEVNIYVDYVVRQERVRPQPQIVRPLISQHFVLQEGGKVDVAYDVGGKYPDKGKTSSRLGKPLLKVIDQRTLSATWSLGDQRRTLTVTTEGKTCTAKLDITGSPEFRSRSTDLNQMAVYRNTQVESITCRIE
jgi:hypothetical protein